MINCETFEDFDIVRETDDAYLFVIRDSARDDAVWVPKSVCEIDGELRIRTWFCRKEEII